MEAWKLTNKESFKIFFTISIIVLIPMYLLFNYGHYKGHQLGYEKGKQEIRDSINLIKGEEIIKDLIIFEQNENQN